MDRGGERRRGSRTRSGRAILRETNLTFGARENRRELARSICDSTGDVRKHKDALLRRRIKFVVEKGAMARLFREGTHEQLQKRLFKLLNPKTLASFSTRKAYNDWLNGIVKSGGWRAYVGKDRTLKSVRWAYVAKLLNILIYEIVSNRELFSETSWRKIQRYLHVPIDSNVLGYISQFDPDCLKIKPLYLMTAANYRSIQNTAREVARALGVPPIWFEAAYSPEAKLSRKLRS
jgi:hypothetical protein